MNAARSAPTRAADPYAHVRLPLIYAVPVAALPDGPTPGAGSPQRRASSYALEAARQAVADAALGCVDSSRLAVVIGTGMGDADLPEQWRTAGFPANAGWAPTFAVASAVGALLGAEGANTSVSNACAASGYALSLAADLIRTGEADVVVAGGAEAYSRVGVACFDRLGALDSQRCRPFDRNRTGTVFGEGAAVLVLESGAYAQARQAPHAYACLAGAGWSCDAYHVTAPEPNGTQIIRSMRHALAEAGARPDDIGCVIPHGTGTQHNDVVESRALHAVLGHAAPGTPLYSLKGLIGHTGGAAGAMGALAAALILDRRCVPPNVPLDEQDPECQVALPTAPTRLGGSCALVNAYAFGGNNIALLLRGLDT